MNETIQSAFSWRYATKTFNTQKKISPKDWATLEESLRLAPSSMGLQPWKFLIIKDASLRSQLRTVSWNQSQIEDASHLVVIAHLKRITPAYVDKYINETAKQRNLPPDALTPYKQMILGATQVPGFDAICPAWTAKQAYIAMGCFMTAAAVLRIDTCPMEGIEAAKYDELLGLTNSDYQVTAVLAAGYRSDKDNLQSAAKSRFSHEFIFESR